MALKIDPATTTALEATYSEVRWCYLRRDERRLLTDPGQIAGNAKNMLFPVLKDAAYVVHLHRCGVVAVGIHRGQNGLPEPGVRIAAAIAGTGDMFSRDKGVNLALRRLAFGEKHSGPVDLSNPERSLGRLIDALELRLPKVCREAYQVSVYAFEAMIKDITGADLKGLRPEISSAAGMLVVDTQLMAQKFNRLATMEKTISEFRPTHEKVVTRLLGVLARAARESAAEAEKEASQAKNDIKSN